MQGKSVGVRITIVGAQGLRKADLTGTPDTYCTCSIAGKKKMRCKTTIILDSSDPVWNYTHEFLDCAAGNSLNFAVYDKDIGGDELLGNASLEHSRFGTLGYTGKLELKDAGVATNAWLAVKIEIIGKGCDQQDAPETKAQPTGLRVTIIGAHQLWKDGQPSASYCSARVVGRKDSTRMSFATPVVSKSRAPIWNHTHEIPLFYPGDSIQFRVLEKDWSGDEVLGKVTLEHSQVYPSGFDDFLTLEESENGKATLTVRVEVFEPQPKAVRISVLDASGLRHEKIKVENVSWYCVCSVPTRKDLRFKTSVVRGVEDPVWNHVHEFMMMPPPFSLQFNIFHNEQTGDDLFGKAMLDDGRFLPTGFHGKLDLRREGQDAGAQLHVKVDLLWLEVQQEVASKESHAPQQGAKISHSELSTNLESAGLRITVFDAHSLWKTRSRARNRETFCAVHIVERSDVKFRTATCSHAVAPSWKHTGLLPECFPGDHVQFRVYEADFTCDDLMGQVTLQCGKLFAGFEGTLDLQDAECDNSKLSVKIEAVPCRLKGLRITIVDLRGVQGFGGTDHVSFYCLCSDPRRKGTRFKTHLIEDAPRLEWNSTHEIGEFHYGHSLQFTVYRKDDIEETMLGKGTLRAPEFEKHGYEGRVRLKSSDDNLAKVLLGVKIEVLPWKGERLSVKIVCARGMLHGQSVLGSTVYCKCCIRGSSEQGRVFKTPAIMDNAVPTWNSKHEFLGFSPYDALQISVYNGDYFAENELLGTATLEYDSLSGSGFDGALNLHNVDGDKLPATIAVQAMFLSAGATHKGASAESGKYSIELGVRVAIISARGAHLVQGNVGTSIYCVCANPSKRDKRFKTLPAIIGEDAMWNESHDFHAWLLDNALHFRVFFEGDGNAPTGKDKLLGYATLDPAQFVPQGFHGELPLKQAEAEIHATLAIKVDLLPEHGSLNLMSSMLNQRKSKQHMKSAILGMFSSEFPPEETDLPNALNESQRWQTEISPEHAQAILEVGSVGPGSAAQDADASHHYAGISRPVHTGGIIGTGYVASTEPEQDLLPQLLRPDGLMGLASDLATPNDAVFDAFRRYKRGQQKAAEKMPWEELEDQFQGRLRELRVKEWEYICMECGNTGFNSAGKRCKGPDDSGCEHGDRERAQLLAAIHERWKRIVRLVRLQRVFTVLNQEIRAGNAGKQKPMARNQETDKREGWQPGQMLKATLRVTVLSARGLARAKTKIGPHPICFCYSFGLVLKQMFKTHIARNTRNPDWRFSHTFDFHGEGLQFDIYDTDIRGDPLGVAKVGADSFGARGRFEAEVDVVETKDGGKAQLLVKVEVIETR